MLCFGSCKVGQISLMPFWFSPLFLSRYLKVWEENNYDDAQVIIYTYSTMGPSTKFVFFITSAF